MKRITLLGLSLLAVGGCSERKKMPSPRAEDPNAVSGRVLLPIGERDNVTVEGATVYYVSEWDFREHVSWLRRTVPQAMHVRSHWEELARISQTLREIETDFPQGEAEEFLASAREAAEAADAHVKNHDALADIRSIWKAYYDREKLFRKMDRYSTTAELWQLSATFLHWLPGEVKTRTRTDAEGHFSISVPGNGFLFVESHRSRPGAHPQLCFWAHGQVAGKGGPGDLGLSAVVGGGDYEIYLEHFDYGITPEADKLIRELDLHDLSWFGRAEELIERLRANEELISNAEETIRECEARLAEAGDGGEE